MRIATWFIISIPWIGCMCAPQEEKTVLEYFLPLYRSIRKIVTDALANSENGVNRQILHRRGKDFVSKSVDFYCNLNITTRSKQVPKSVHQVRPGDIDVIGALGDSLTVAFGASANSLFQMSEARGRSFSGGGQGTWRTSITLPNIIKVYNSNLIGYSVRTSTSLDKESQFNVAELGAISSNLPYMAKVLIKRIKTDPRINIKRDWKMITYMIGNNDFCSEMCYYRNPEIVLKRHKEDLMEVLRIFKKNLPRTIVNVVPPPNLKVLTTMTNKPSFCHLSHSFACPCIIGLAYKNKRKLFFDIMERWQHVDIEVSNLPEFDMEDFTVIPHYYTLNYTFPTTTEGVTDYSYLSEDCFHFSQKGQSRFAHDLWNSLLEPFGNKSFDGSDIFEKFNCPSEEHPFIFTRRNSFS